MRPRPEFVAPVGRTRVERAVRADVLVIVEGLPQIVAVARAASAVRLLRVEAGPRQIVIGDAWDELVADDGLGHERASTPASVSSSAR